MKRVCLILNILAGLFSTAALAGPENVNWPGDYKSNFTFYFSGDRTANEKQAIRIYANDTALSGVRNDGKLPFGSVVVGELYMVRLDDKEQPIKSSHLPIVVGSKAPALLSR